MVNINEKEIGNFQRKRNSYTYLRVGEALVAGHRQHDGHFEAGARVKPIPLYHSKIKMK